MKKIIIVIAIICLMSGCSELKRSSVTGNTEIPVAVLDSIRNCKDSNTHVVEHSGSVYEYTAKKPTYVVRNSTSDVGTLMIFVLVTAFALFALGLVIFID